MQIAERFLPERGDSVKTEVPILRSKRLILRRHVEEDLDAAAAMWSDPDVIRYIGGRAFTREEVWHRILRYVGHWQLRPYGYWAMHDRADDRFVGEIGFADWKRSKVTLASPEAGWVLIPAIHGRGYATEAISLMLDWADALPVPRTCCIIDKGNLASIKLAERFGYVPSAKAEGDAPAIFERIRPPASRHQPTPADGFQGCVPSSDRSGDGLPL